MKKLKILFTVKKIKIIFFFILTLIAQTEISAQDKIQNPETGVKASFLGSIIYPGFKIGIERPFKVIEIEKKNKTILKERFWTYNLGFYQHKTFHTNIFLLAERQKRRQFPNGVFIESAQGIGYSHTFLDGATFVVNDNGESSKKSMAGYNYAILSLSGGIGYDFSKKSKSPINTYLKTSVLVMAPYNSFVYTRPTLELGLIYSLKSFWKANPLVKKNK